MNVLVTGANGFLGRHVTAAFLGRGHRVRALVRPTARLDGPLWKGVDVVRADLRNGRNLDRALDGVDVLAHLAACVAGDDETRFLHTVVGTERLLAAMAGAAPRRIVLASSFAVYDWSAARGTLTEETPVETRVYERDGYAVAKLWQERIVRRAAARDGRELVVVRPGFIWGRENRELSGVAYRVGPAHLVLGARTRLPLTHVENCADLFVLAAESPAAAGETFNAVDDEGVLAARWIREFVRRTDAGGFRVVLPYTVTMTAIRAGHWLARRTFGAHAKLPGLLVPRQFQARFKPLRFSNRKARERLGWTPRLSFAECLERTYEPARDGIGAPALATDAR